MPSSTRPTANMKHPRAPASQPPAVYRFEEVMKVLAAGSNWYNLKIKWADPAHDPKTAGDNYDVWAGPHTSGKATVPSDIFRKSGCTKGTEILLKRTYDQYDFDSKEWLPSDTFTVPKKRSK